VGSGVRVRYIAITATTATRRTAAGIRRSHCLRGNNPRAMVVRRGCRRRRQRVRGRKAIDWSKRRPTGGAREAGDPDHRGADFQLPYALNAVQQSAPAILHMAHSSQEEATPWRMCCSATTIQPAAGGHMGQVAGRLPPMMTMTFARGALTCISKGSPCIHSDSA